MLGLVSFFTGPLGKFLLAGAAVVAVLTGTYVKGRSDQHGPDQIHERNAVAAVQRDLDTCHSNGQALQAALDRQGAAVTALKAESDARVAASVKAVSGARAVAESYRQNAASILKAKPGVDRCQSADQLVLEAVK